MTPKVSILIPVYNRVSFVSDCIQSALDQTYTDFEIVIVDNASDDGTWEICQRFAGIDPRVRVFRNETNIGPVRNWLRCAQESTGEYTKILFSDDLINEDCVERMVQFMSDTVAFVYSSVHVGETEFETKVLYDSKEDVLLRAEEYLRLLLCWKAPVSPGAILLRRSDLLESLQSNIASKKKCDFFSHGAGPDVLIMLNSIRNRNMVFHIAEPLSYFRSHANSFTVSNKNNSIFESYTAAISGYLEMHNLTLFLSQFIARQWLKSALAYKSFSTLDSFKHTYLEQPSAIKTFDVLKNIPKILIGEVVNRIIRKCFKKRGAVC